MSNDVTVTAIGDAASISEDNQHAGFPLILDGGQQLTLTMSVQTLEALAIRATELFRAVRSRSGATHAPLETAVARAMGISAQEAIGGQAVVLTILDENGLDHRFALHPEQSARLRPQMRRAEINATSQAGQARQ